MECYFFLITNLPVLMVKSMYSGLVDVVIIFTEEQRKTNEGNIYPYLKSVLKP